MADVRALIRESGQVRNSLDTDVLRIGGVDIGAAGTLTIGTATATAITIGDVGVTTTFPGDVSVEGILTIVDGGSLIGDGDVTLGGGDGDTITLGGSWVSADDIVNIGTVNGVHNTTVNLRCTMGVGQDKRINFDRTAASEGALLLPDTKDAPVGLAVGMIRITAAGSLDWYNGAAWSSVASTSYTLDQAYDAGGAGLGRSITADSGAVTITVPDGSNNAVLEITQNDVTNNPTALSVTNSGTGASLYLDGTTQSIWGTGNVVFDTPGKVSICALAGAGIVFGELARSLEMNCSSLVLTSSDAMTLNMVANFAGPLVLTIDAYNSNVGGSGYINIDDTYRRLSTAGGGYSAAMPYSSAKADWDDFKTNFGDGTSLLAAINSCAAPPPPSTTLDDAYNNFGVAPATITVDAKDVTWSLVGAYSFVVDTSGCTGVADGFIVSDGTDNFQLLHKGANTLALSTALSTVSLEGSDTYSLSMAANDAAAKTMTISAANAGAGSALLDINAKGNITIDSSAGTIGIGVDAVSQNIYIGTAGVRTINLGNVLATSLAANAIAISLDATADSNFTVTSNSGAARTLTLRITNAGAGAGDLDIDAKSAVTIDSAAAGISLDGVTSSNFTVTANSAGAQTLVIAVTNAGAGTGVLDIDAKSAITIDSAAAGISLDAAGNSNFSVTSAALTISTITAGQLDITSAGLLVLCDAYKAASSYATDLVLSDNAAEWTLYDTNFGEVSILNALSQCAPAAAGWVFAQNTDVDIASSPETVDTFTTATLGGGTPVSGGVAWRWFAVGMSDSTNHVSGGWIGLSWDGDLTYHLDVTRDWADGGEITFSVTVTNPAADTVTVTLKATTTVDNYCVQVRRMPYFTAAATV